MAKEFAVLILPITAFLLIIFFLHNIWRIIPSGLIFRYITSKRTWKILIKIIYSGEFQITDDQTYGHGAFSIGIDFLEFIFDPFFRERQNDRKFKSRAVCWSCDFRHCYTLWFGNLYELIFFWRIYSKQQTVSIFAWISYISRLVFFYQDLQMLMYNQFEIVQLMLDFQYRVIPTVSLLWFLERFDAINLIGLYIFWFCDMYF